MNTKVSVISLMNEPKVAYCHQLLPLWLPFLLFHCIAFYFQALCAPPLPPQKCAVGVRQSWLCHWCVLNVSFKGCLHCADTCMSLNTHTHHRLTALCPGQPGWAGTRKVKSIWILLKQETVSGNGISWAICKSAPRSGQITMPTRHHSVFTGRMPFLSINQQCQSTDSYIKYSWIQYVVLQSENLLSFCHIFSVFVSCYRCLLYLKDVYAYFVCKTFWQ